MLKVVSRFSWVDISKAFLFLYDIVAFNFYDKAVSVLYSFFTSSLTQLPPQKARVFEPEKIIQLGPWPVL